jgi:hypothetical protein
MTDAPRSPERTVTLHEGVIDVLQAMTSKVQEGYKRLDTATSYEELVRIQRDLLEHQATLLNTVVGRLTFGSHDGRDHDGHLNLFVESGQRPLSLGFHHAGSGYHGGLLFWPQDGDTGRWQTHT